MPIKFERRPIGNQCQQLSIMHCPIELLDFAARLAGVDVTVENLRPIRSWNEWVSSSQALFPGGPIESYKIKNAEFDVFLSLEQFLAFLPQWNQLGVFAIFSAKGAIKFRASDIAAPARYIALKKEFDFQLEFALAGPSSSGQSSIVSPREDLIQGCENFLLRHA